MKARSRFRLYGANKTPMLTLANNDQLRRQVYRDLFKVHLDTGIIDEIRSSTNGNFVLGSVHFKDEIASMLQRRVVPLKAGRPTKAE